MREFDESQLSPPHIVCAACRYRFNLDYEPPLIIVGARHFDMVMHRQIQMFIRAYGEPNRGNWEQGFIDQHGRFYDRREAMKIVLGNGQPFDPKRNGGNGEELYSEGLY